jgi:hypothetical protein
MLDDLGDIADLIGLADKACHRVMMRLGEPYGLNDDAVDSHLRQMVEKIQHIGG